MKANRSDTDCKLDEYTRIIQSIIKRMIKQNGSNISVKQTLIKKESQVILNEEDNMRQ